MAYMQVAKLYLRGSLYNKTLKNLQPQQLEEIETIIKQVLKDPNLQQCKIEFCSALAHTIRNEYTDREHAEQDYMIAIMKAAIAAKYGYAGKPPAQEAITDQTQRKKWFQTWAFNYLRQILRENKLPRIKRDQTIILPADQAAIEQIKTAIHQTIQDQHDHRYKRTLTQLYDELEIEEKPNGYKINFNHWSYPIELVHRIRKISITYLKYHVQINQTSNGIEITRKEPKMKKIQITKKTEELVKMTSFNIETKENQKNTQSLEDKVIRTKPPEGGLKVEEEEILDTLRNKIPDEAKQILDIYMEERRPPDYIEKYGDNRPKISHVARYLNKSPREIKKLLNIIKVHCLALEIGR